MSKLKNILFEEEEVEIPVIEKKEEVKREPVYKEMPKKEEVTNNYNNYNNYKDLEPVIREEKKLEEQNVVRKDIVSDRELFKSEKTFNFPAFDEEEFKSMTPKPKTRSTNILEREKNDVKKQEYKPLERKEETHEKPKFKPSPIISPVYGILDKNYTPDEITSRNDNEMSRKLDVDSVRKKAFGELPKEKEEEIELNEKSLDDQILEEKLEKARTIDELLKDSSDDAIDINEEVSESKDEEPIKEEVLENIEPVHEENLEDDTLENDLFDLIDSMYENREDGE